MKSTFGKKQWNRINYPTLKQVEAAEYKQICYWYRFLPSPGFRNPLKYQKPDLYTRLIHKQITVLKRIIEKFRAGGGMTLQIRQELRAHN